MIHTDEFEIKGSVIKTVEANGKMLVTFEVGGVGSLIALVCCVKYFGEPLAYSYEEGDYYVGVLFNSKNDGFVQEWDKIFKGV